MAAEGDEVTAIAPKPLTTADTVRISTLVNRHLGSHVTWLKSGASAHIAYYESKVGDDGEVKYTSPAIAWYEPGTGDIRVDLTRLFTPESGRTMRSLRQELSPYLPTDLVADLIAAQLWGLLVHEASHSAWSTWRPIKGTPALVVDTMMMLEELRIERRAVAHYAATKQIPLVLRASARLVHDTLDLSKITTTRGLARAWALLRGRVNAGVVTPEEVQDINLVALTVLGDETVGLLGDLLDEAIELNLERDRTTELLRLHEIAVEWLDLLRNESDDDGEGEGEGGGSEGEGEGESEGEPEGEGKGKSKSKSDPKEDGDDESKSDGGGGDEGDEGDEGESEGGDADKPVDEPDMGELGQDPTKEHEDDPGRDLTRDEKDMLDRVLEKTLDQIELGDDRPTLSDPKKMAQEVVKRGYSSAYERRKPTTDELRWATKLTHELETLTLPAIVKTVHHAVLPPGRLRTREAVRAGAERSKGQMVTAKPFRDTKRRHQPTLPMIVGVMTDTSGSMSWAETLVAQTAYIFGVAGNRVGARTAAVTFGNRANPVVTPGVIPKEVVIYSANGRHERFDWAAAAMDGLLNLTTKTGAAKVLVIVSDANLVLSGEPEKANAWLDRWVKAGVQVVWVGSRHEFTQKPGVINVRDVEHDRPNDLARIVVNELRKKGV